jgi:hypothetical protein
MGEGTAHFSDGGAFRAIFSPYARRWCMRPRCTQSLYAAWGGAGRGEGRCDGWEASVHPPVTRRSAQCKLSRTGKASDGAQ